MTVPNQFYTPQAYRYTLQNHKGQTQGFINFQSLPPQCRALGWLYEGSDSCGAVARFVIQALVVDRTLGI